MKSNTATVIQMSGKEVKPEQIEKTLFEKVVAVLKKALANELFMHETFAQVKARVLRSFTKEIQYHLIKDEENWRTIEYRANRSRFNELVAISLALVSRHEGDKNIAVKKSGKKDFFQFICGELLLTCQDDLDLIRVKEVIEPAVATAFSQKRKINEEAKRRKEKDQQFKNAGKDVATFASKNPVIILGDPSELSDIILASEKSHSTQGMLRYQLIELVSKMTRQEKLDVLYVCAKDAVDAYFGVYPKALFRKGETTEQLNALSEKVRISSRELSFVGKRNEVYLAITRAIMDKRNVVGTAFRKREKEQLLQDGLGRIEIYQQKRSIKKPGSASRRHAVRFPEGKPKSEGKKAKNRKRR